MANKAERDTMAELHSRLKPTVDHILNVYGLNEDQRVALQDACLYLAPDDAYTDPEADTTETSEPPTPVE